MTAVEGVNALLATPTGRFRPLAMDVPSSNNRQDRFERLLGEYARVIAHAARKVCAPYHGALAEDVEQECCLNLWKHLANGKEIENPASYLYKMALTTALRLIRKDRKASADAEPAIAEVPDPKPRVREGLARHDLERLLARCPPDQQRALRAYLAGLNHVEIADLFGWSESQARHRVYRGIESLRKAYHQMEAGKEAHGR